MKLSSSFSNDYLEVVVTSLTVIEPGEKSSIVLRWTALKKCFLSSLIFTVKNAPVKINLDIFQMKSFPLTLEAGNSFEMAYPIMTNTDEEGFGIIYSETSFKTADDETMTLKTDTWISVFKYQMAENQGLSDPLRKRLINVVNYRTRNGHIFLADHVLFFRDFINTGIPEEIVKMLSSEFELPKEGLPLDEETRYKVIIGKSIFYSISLELIAEEECTESDSRFDAHESMEVKVMEV
jgi:hypothetical protein